jgi:hypothetical protein
MFRMNSISRVLVIMLVAVTGCASGAAIPARDASVSRDVRADLRKAAEPYALKLTEWEIENMIAPVEASRAGGVSGLDEKITTVLCDEKMPVIPAVRIRLTRPPLLLVISPEEKIEYMDRLLLSADLSEGQIEEVERKVDELNLSSLVVELGGFAAAYPPIVSPEMDTKNVISASVEEWAHQHLAFRPLGFLYLLDSLGYSQSPDVISMNETLAGIIADEIGAKVVARYYPSAAKPDQTTPSTSDFNFNLEMKQTRQTVDVMLKQGNLERAEQYMESRRWVFVQHGYKIRKLNQAYFAFHGIYGQDPCAVGPIYDAMTSLRKNYANLADFARDVSGMTSYEDLRSALGRQPLRTLK